MGTSSASTGTCPSLFNTKYITAGLDVKKQQNRAKKKKKVDFLGAMVRMRIIPSGSSVLPSHFWLSQTIVAPISHDGRGLSVTEFLLTRWCCQTGEIYKKKTNVKGHEMLGR